MIACAVEPHTKPSLKAWKLACGNKLCSQAVALLVGFSSWHKSNDMWSGFCHEYRQYVFHYERYHCCSGALLHVPTGVCMPSWAGLPHASPRGRGVSMGAH